MRKKTIMLLTALVVTLLLVGCSKNDEGEQNSVTCDVLGILPATIENNGDGTATITIDGESATTDLDGMDFSTFADSLCSGNLDLEF